MPILNDFTMGGAVVAAVAAMWRKLQMLSNKLFSFVFVTVKINDGQLRSAAISFLIKSYKISSVGNIRVIGENEFVKPLRVTRRVAFKTVPNEPMLWRKGKQFIVVSDDSGSEVLTITYLRGTFDYITFIEDAISYMLAECLSDAEDESGRYFIRKEYGSIGERVNDRSSGRNTAPGDSENSERPLKSASRVSTKYEAFPLKWGVHELGRPRKLKAIDNLYLNESALGAYEEAKKWKSAENWFKDRDIPWKRGWLLTGEQGTGKTAFVRAIAQVLNMPIMQFNLSTMTSVDFIKSWERCVGYLPCIFLFEDIDNVFHGRTNVCSTANIQGLTFDIFLNVIDGVDSTDGIFIIMTTNHLDKVDPALGNFYNGMSTRPGRIDKVIEFDRLTKAGKVKIANRIFEGVSEERWSHLLEDKYNDTGAQFQERCSRLALQLWYEGQIEVQEVNL